MKRRVLKYGVGYFIAVTVAIFIAETILLAPTVLPDDGRLGSFFMQIRDLPAIFMIGFLYTFVTALPGFLITIYLSIRYSFGNRNFFCVAGMLTALLAHIVFAAFAGGFVFSAYIVFFCSVLGGAAGGYAYHRWQENFLSSSNDNSVTTSP